MASRRFDTPDRSELAVRTAQLEEPPPPITSVVPSAPPVLDVLMAHALAKNPALRYPSALELGEAFRTALGLPLTQGWNAQKELAALAKTISGLELPEVPPTQADAQERAEALQRRPRPCLSKGCRVSGGQRNAPLTVFGGACETCHGLDETPSERARPAACFGPGRRGGDRLCHFVARRVGASGRGAAPASTRGSSESTRRATDAAGSAAVETTSASGAGSEAARRRCRRRVPDEDERTPAPAPAEPPPCAPAAPSAMPLWPEPAADAAALERQGGERPQAKPGGGAAFDDRVYAEDWWAHARPVFEVHGYFRVRSQLFHRFNLGRLDAPGQAMWPRAPDDFYLSYDPTT